MSSDVTTQNEGNVPEFITPRTIDDMQEDEIEQFVSRIREGRMVAVLAHTQAIALKNRVRGQKLQDKIQKFADRVHKKLEKIDEMLEDVQGLSGQLRALRREALDQEDVE